MSMKQIDNFNLRTNKALDIRFSVDTLSEIDLPYDGLITYHRTEKKFYKFIDGIWEELLKGLNTIVSIKNYGAIGNNINDDTLSIQNAIDDVHNNGGGLIFIPSGIYLTSGIVIKDNVILLGENKNTSILKRIDISNQTHFIKASGNTNFSLIEIKIDCNKTSQHSFLYTDSIHIDNSYNFEIKNCNIINSINRGIFVNKNTDKIYETISTIKDNSLVNSGSALIQVTDCSNIEIDNNIVKNSFDSGIVCNYTTNRYLDVNIIEITNNTVCNNPKVGIWCYSVTDSQDDRFLAIGRIIINDNNVHDNSWHGIITQINESYLVGNIVFNNGNTVDGDKGMGITANTKNVSISGGSIYGNSGCGIDLGDCSDIIIQNVMIKENGTMGIEVNSSENVLIDSCIIKDNNTTNNATPFATNNGITVYHNSQFTDNSKNVQIKNCKITRNNAYYQNYGIYLESTGDNTSIIGNDLFDSGNITDLKVQNTNYIAKDNITKDSNYALNGSTITLQANQNTLTIPSSGDVFFLELASGASSGANINVIVTDGVTTPKGNKVTLIINNPFITFKSGTGNIYHAKKVETVYQLNGVSPNFTLSSSQNIINDPDIGGNLTSVTYLCNGGAGNASWIEVCHTLGR